MAVSELKYFFKSKKKVKKKNQKLKERYAVVSDVSTVSKLTFINKTIFLLNV